MMDFEKIASAAFEDELRKIAGDKFQMSSSEIEALLKEAGLFSSMAQGVQRAGSAVASGVGAAAAGVKNQYGQLQNHVGQALANSTGGHGGSVMSGTNMSPMMQGAGNYLASKMPGNVGHQIAHAGTEVAQTAANPALAGIKPALGHAIGHGAEHMFGHLPGAAGAIGSFAAPMVGALGAGLATTGIGAAAKKLLPGAAGAIQHGMNAFHG